MAPFGRYLIIPCLLAACVILAGCTGSQTQTPVQTPTPAGEPMPGLTITSPADGAVLPAGNITVSVAVSNFRLSPEL